MERPPTDPAAPARARRVRLAAYWLRGSRRRRWRSWVVLGLLVGLLGGGVLTALAGAQRTETAYGRFIERTNAWDVVGYPACDPDAGGGAPTVGRPGGAQAPAKEAPNLAKFQACVARLAALPSVADATTVNQYGAQFAPVGGQPFQLTGDTCYSGPGAVYILGDPSGRFGTALNRLQIVAGRAANPAAADEVVVSRDVAQRLDLRPGDALLASMVSYERCLDAPDSFPEPTRFTVVGVAVASSEVRPASGFYLSSVLVTPAFTKAAGTEALDDRAAAVRLKARGEAAVSAFLSDVEAAGLQFHPAFVQSDYAADLQRGINPAVTALRILAVLLALAGVAVLGPLLVRQTAIESADIPVLRSLGASRLEQLAAAAAWGVPTAAIAAVTATAVALAGSWWTPIGEARVVEPDPGVRVVAHLLLLTIALVVCATLAAATLPTLRLLRRTPATRNAPIRPSRVVEALTRASLPPSATTGVRMALEPSRGRATLPVRSSIVAITVGVFTMTASVAFGADLAHLLKNPRLVGWNWDARIAYPTVSGDSEQPIDPSRLSQALADNPTIESFGYGVVFTPFVNGLELGEDHQAVGSMAFDSSTGEVGPSMIEGRAPSADDELLLGPVTADALGVKVGDHVTAFATSGEWEQPDTYQDFATEMEVVGLGVLPMVNGRLGTGASMTTDGLATFIAADRGPDSLFLRFAGTADPAEVVREIYTSVGLPAPDPAQVAEALAFTDGVPVLDVERVDQLPLLLTVLMSLMSAAVLAHVLASSTSAHRSDLALLRAIGFDGRQIRHTVACQAAAVVIAACAVAVPLGLAAGRLVWLEFAERMGVVPETTAPVQLLVVIPAVLLVALLLATVTARSAHRRPPAEVLRSE